jgi:hypothetical protein
MAFCRATTVIRGPTELTQFVLGYVFRTGGLRMQLHTQVLGMDTFTLRFTGGGRKPARQVLRSAGSSGTLWEANPSARCALNCLRNGFGASRNIEFS